MNRLHKLVISCLCLFASCNADTYKAAIVDVSMVDVTIDMYAPLIHEAFKMDANILVLPFPELPNAQDLQEICSVDKYDQIVKTISDAAKSVHLYVVAHLFEKIRCQETVEIIRNNLVFDRDGSVISFYRKPLHGSARCNITTTNSRPFTTDFGVTFGLLMEEDLVIQNPENYKGIKNFALTGKPSTNVPFLTANHFSSSWSYVTNANLVSSKGIYAGKAGLKTGSGRIVVAELDKAGGEVHPAVYLNRPTKLTNFPGEDLSQYIIKPLDIEASGRGYQETVCHGEFCCEFHLKTRFTGNPAEVSYGLAAGDGAAVKTCSLVACAGLYKRTCFASNENTTNILFEELSVSANFTKESVEFPIIQTTVATAVGTKNFFINEESTYNKKLVSAKLHETQNLLRFAIFSRDYSKEFEGQYNFENENKTNTVLSEASDYISSENVQEFFDYVWIRLRFLIFIVSIYILEMM